MAWWTKPGRFQSVLTWANRLRLGATSPKVTTRLVLLVLVNSFFIGTGVLAAVIVILLHEGETDAERSLDRNVRVAWNELTRQGRDIELADGVLSVGGVPLTDGNEVVDKVAALVGGAATIFAGDVRVATTIRQADGTRAIGTTLAHNAAYRAVFERHTPYRGMAEILGEPYVTVYDPIFDKQGGVVGAVFVGIPRQQFFKSLDRTLDWMALSILLTVSLSFALAMRLVGKSVSVPIKAITATMKRLAAGDHALHIPGVDRTDEIGDMAKAVEIFKRNAIERASAEEQVKELAFYDPLTRLPNRRLLLDRLRQTLAVGTRSGRGGALFFIDLDNFKTLNDTLGHDKGDLLLQIIAKRLVNCIREGDTVARFGGDEFVVVLENLSENPTEAAAQAEIVGIKIIASICEPLQLAGHDYRATASIGSTLFAAQRADIEELLKQADIAMYQAKAAGRDRLRFFDPVVQAAVSARATLESDLRKGIENNQFSLYYQPQVEYSRVVGAEALLRWQHPERGMVSPADFIPLAEESALILSLGHWVLETACKQIAAWGRRWDTAQITVAVNVSARQFRQPDFVEQVTAVVERTKANPRNLKLEMTESMLIDNVEDVIGKMTALKAHGMKFSLDDFGTGYSSLSYLKRLPLSQLKIDRSFVKDVLTNPSDAAIARTIIALGKSLGLGVIAEGVETEAQQTFFSLNKCHSYQGYLFSPPVPIERFEALVAGQ
jgi:diguanylate cyclase (GGDEF)-like protein